MLTLTLWLTSDGALGGKSASSSWTQSRRTGARLDAAHVAGAVARDGVARFAVGRRRATCDIAVARRESFGRAGSEMRAASEIWAAARSNWRAWFGVEGRVASREGVASGLGRRRGARRAARVAPVAAAAAPARAAGSAVPAVALAPPAPVWTLPPAPPPPSCAEEVDLPAGSDQQDRAQCERDESNHTLLRSILAFHRVTVRSV
jgi:hypothetical protein